MPSRQELIRQQRIEKLDRIRALGVEPYPHSFHSSHTAQRAVALLEQQESEGAAPAEISLAGRVMAKRRMGRGAFFDIRDDSGKLQLLFQNVDKYPERDRVVFSELDTGDIIGVNGTMLRTRTGEPTVAVAGFSLLAKSLQPLPEKWHGLVDTDTRYRQRYLDLISNAGAKQTFEVRSQTIAAIRQFLNARGFVEAETPVLLPSSGGALARPFITHHNALDQDFYLRIATELHLKRLIIGGFDKVYEIGRTFRNEGVSTTHSPEFTMLESYEAYADYFDVMQMVEEMVCAVCRQVTGTLQIEFAGAAIDLTPPWRRVTLRDAVKEHSGIDFVTFPTADGLRARMRSLGMDVDPESNWAGLVDELLKTFVRPALIRPTFVYDYPVSMSPLAKTKPGEKRVVERFQAFAAGSLELANAYSELNDPIEQRQRFTEQMQERHGAEEERWTIDEDFLLALEYGMPPTGGLGVGIDRLVMLLTDQQSIREVILFPQLRGKG
jgi:lysyl-tRNA synthetase class 2